MSSLPTPFNYNMMDYTAPDLTETLPFNSQESWFTITCEGAKVTPTINAKTKKSFFYSSDADWTCYRRNYFEVQVSLGLNPWIPSGRLYLDQGDSKGPEQIQSMAVSLAAAVDSSTGTRIELVRQTPKRDKGPKLTMGKILLAPTPPGEHHHDNYSVNFERLQFKSATANNGKRRAQQQYYILIVELWANVQDHSSPVWIKIGARSSHPAVVRGRPPKHYANKSDGGSGVGGPGHPGLSPNGGPTYVYRGTAYPLDPRLVGSHLVSSTSSLGGGTVEGLLGDQHMIDEEDSKIIPYEGYLNYI